jgi:alpha-mannosidase
MGTQHRLRRRFRAALCGGIGALIFWFAAKTVRGMDGSGRQASASAGATKPVLLLIPHTHWEGAVFKTREGYLQVGLPNILAALEMLRQHPEYRFVLDQVAYIKPFLERYPNEESTFRRFLSDGRLQVAGATNVMHDNNMPSGESIAHQLLLGKTYFRDKLNYEVKTGWGLDTFGHNAQMPQLLKSAGLESYWFQRGVPGVDTPSEFWWEGIDGTRIAGFWLPFGYGNFFEVPKSQFEFDAFARRRFAQLDAYAKGPERMLLAGSDVAAPEEDLPAKVAKFNANSNAPFVIRFATPADYEKDVAQRAERQIVRGELNPLFQGIYSSRIELKQIMRGIESLLLSAEKLDVIGDWLGGRSNQSELAQAWEPLLFNQTHDLTSGVMVDDVYEDTVQGYSFSRQLGEDLVGKGMDGLASRVDTRGEGIPIIVFNPLGWKRTDAAELSVGFSDNGFQELAVADSEGHAVPFQLSKVTRYANGGIQSADLVFIAREIPAMGYSIFHVSRKPDATKADAAPDPNPALAKENASASRQDEASIENQFIRARLNLWTGDLTSVVTKNDGWEALKGAGNVVAREEDGGDFWELYGTLNGARFPAMTREVGLPKPGRTSFSSEAVGGGGHTENGPVFSECRVSHPFGKNEYTSTLRLYRDVQRLDIATEILNQEAFVRYRVLFPATISDGRNTQEIPFGAIERKQSQEFPAQNWMDFGDDRHGLALLNRGLPGNNIAQNVMMLSLARSSRLISYGYIGGYEPGVSSDTGLELGKRLTFHYALVPHSGDWRQAEIFRQGMEFNHPLIAKVLAAHPGDLPKRWGFLSVEPGNVVVSAVKPASDGDVLLRVYEATGKPAQNGLISFTPRLASARESDIVEDQGAPVRISGNAISCPLHPFEIKSFRLKFEPERKP